MNRIPYSGQNFRDCNDCGAQIIPTAKYYFDPSGDCRAFSSAEKITHAGRHLHRSCSSCGAWWVEECFKPLATPPPPAPRQPSVEDQARQEVEELLNSSLEGDD